MKSSISRFPLFIIVLAMLYGLNVFAESTSSGNTTVDGIIINSQGGTAMTTENGTYNPAITGSQLASIAQAEQSGSVNGTGQLLASMSTFTSCEDPIINNLIPAQVSYNAGGKAGTQGAPQNAVDDFQQKICGIWNCYEQASLMAMLATTSSNTQAGGTGNQNCAQAAIVQFLQAAQNPSSGQCGSSFPPELLTAVLNPTNGANASQCSN